MQTQEIYHAAKSFILTESNGPNVINVLYDYVLFVYAKNKKYNSSPEHIIINLATILISFIPHTTHENRKYPCQSKTQNKKHYPFHGTRNSFLSHCASQ